MNKCLTLQVENYVPRPLSCEGPSDSGVSVSSEYICPDGDTSSITAQSQTVSRLLHKFIFMMLLGIFLINRRCRKTLQMLLKWNENLSNVFKQSARKKNFLWNFHCILTFFIIIFLSIYSTGYWISQTKAWTRAGWIAGKRADLCQRNEINIERKYFWNQITLVVRCCNRPENFPRRIPKRKQVTNLQCLRTISSSVNELVGTAFLCSS